MAPRLTRSCGPSRLVQGPLPEEDRHLDDHGPGIPVDPSVTRNFTEA